MNKRDRYKWTILTSICIGIVAIIIIYISFISQIVEAFATLDGVWSILTVTLIKVGVVLGMGFILMRRWFRQEAQYLSDIPFLFSMFFIILGFAKFFDLLSAFSFYIDPNIFLDLFKVRFYLIVFELLPMIYLSVGMILYYLSLKDKFSAYSDETRLDKARQKILLVILIIEVTAIMFAPTYASILTILPLLVLPSIITIVWLFAFAYKNQRLTQVHPLIIAVGFGIFLISQISRPIAQRVFGDSATWIIFSETFEIIVFMIIFTGLLLKVKYK